MPESRSRCVLDLSPLITVCPAKDRVRPISRDLLDEPGLSPVCSVTIWIRSNLLNPEFSLGTRLRTICRGNPTQGGSSDRAEPPDPRLERDDFLPRSSCAGDLTLLLFLCTLASLRFGMPRKSSSHRVVRIRCSSVSLHFFFLFSFFFFFGSFFSPSLSSPFLVNPFFFSPRSIAFRLWALARYIALIAPDYGRLRSPGLARPRDSGTLGCVGERGVVNEITWEAFEPAIP